MHNLSSRWILGDLLSKSNMEEVHSSNDYYDLNFPESELFSKDTTVFGNDSLKSIYNNRNIFNQDDLDKYVNISLEDMHDYNLLPDIDKLIDRIKVAIDNNELIFIYGDYDVDGITSTTVMVKTLSHLGADVHYYIPDRFDEGYGINIEALAKISESGAKLVISVDCGITSIEEANYAKSIGLDLIITDHHTPLEILPEAIAVVNPKIKTSKYPFSELAGVGIAFKIALKLLNIDYKKKYTGVKKLLYDELLVIAMFGTIADLVPIVGENRIIVKEGFKALRKGLNFGVDAIFETSGVNIADIKPDDIGYMIAPRINAAGRLSHASVGVELFMASCKESADNIAEELTKLNGQRQYKTTQITKQAKELIDSEPKCSKSGITIVWGDTWHEGVIGIVASKLVETYSRPCIVFSENNGFLKGSARSFGGFSIYDCIISQIEILEKFGGHHSAAGLTIKKENLDIFIEGIEKYNIEHLKSSHLLTKIELDTSLLLEDASFSIYNKIIELSPFGQDNKMPIFCINGVNLTQFRMVGKGANHLKLCVSDGDKVIDGIKFFHTDDFIPDTTLDTRVDLCATLSENVYNGRSSIQLLVEDIRFYHPNSSVFSKKVFQVYMKKFYSWVKKSSNKFNANYREQIDSLLTDRSFMSMRSKKRNIYSLYADITNKRNIIITSYEALLEISYLLFDMGLIDADISENYLDEFDFIKLLPHELSSEILADVPLMYYNDLNSHFDLNKSTVVYNDVFDNNYIIEAFDNWVYDRSYFIGGYKNILNSKNLRLSEELDNSRDLITDFIMWSFFEEANFVNIADNLIEFVDENHTKLEFQDSDIYKIISSIAEIRRIKKWI